jgi:hypothetical protein
LQKSINDVLTESNAE